MWLFNFFIHESEREKSFIAHERHVESLSGEFNGKFNFHFNTLSSWNLESSECQVECASKNIPFLNEKH